MLCEKIHQSAGNIWANSCRGFGPRKDTDPSRNRHYFILRRHQCPTVLCRISTSFRERAVSLIIHSFYSLAFLLLVFHFCYPNDELSNLPFSGHTQNWRRVSNRASSLAMANMPTLFLFAGRNNLLLWITGASYSTFNLFHRWTARVVTAEALVHTVCHMVLWVEGDAPVFPLLCPSCC